MQVIKTLVRAGRIGLVVLLCVTCGGKTPKISQGDVERAQAALKPLKKQLMGALTAAMAEGPEKAIMVCRVEAPRIAREAAPPGVEMGRTSHRVRNPENSPRDWMKPLLAVYKDGTAAGEPTTVLLDDSRFAYVEPIYVKDVCLKCHGENLDPSVKETISDLYPGDKATGFKVKDFRGMFWVSMPLGENN